MITYGNSAQSKPKLRYNFDTGLNDGSWVPNVSSGSYYNLPNNASGYKKGIMGGQLSFTNDYTIGIADYYIECVFYNGSTTTGYSGLVTFGISGMRYGDSGFGNRLQFGSDFSSAGTVYSINVTKTSSLNQIHTLRMERKAGILKCYYDGVQTNFAVGTSVTYSNSQIADSYSIAKANIITCGSSNFPVIKVTMDFK